MLVAGGGAAYTETDTPVARRTAVGRDRAGRLVFVVSPAPFFTLHGLAQWLVSSSGLDLDSAVNLDGGQSTGLWLGAQPEPFLVDSYGKIPAVLVIRTP